MKPTKEMLKEYKAIAKASKRNMKDCIKAHLVAHCPKFQGHEDKFEECIGYVVDCAKEILENRPGEVADDACYKMARDFFNDELWEKDEKKPAKKAAQAPDLEMTEPTPDPEPETPAEAEETKPAPKPEPGQCSLFDLAGFANA
jgi:hypothetical protein